MIRYYDHKNEPNLAERIFDGVFAESHIEEELNEPPFWTDLVDHIGHDHYDSSLEIYFVKATPSDLAITEEQAAIILGWGFWRGWLNFADGTQQHFYSWNPETQSNGVFLGKRRTVNHPHWHGEESK